MWHSIQEKQLAGLRSRRREMAVKDAALSHATENEFHALGDAHRVFFCGADGQEHW